jgi:predicted N-acetyltransferase YhbS
MIVRKAKSDEAEVLTALCRLAKASWGYPEEWMQAWASELLVTSNYIQSSKVLVAEIEGDIVGFGALSSRKEDLDLDHLWVDPTRQRMGVGSVLWARLVEHARTTNASSIYIVSDPFAQPFYEKHGAHFWKMMDAPVLGTPRSLPIFAFEL